MSNDGPQSGFVTAVAWIFIVLAGFASLIVLAQMAMFHFLFQSPEFQHSLNAPAPPGMPAFVPMLLRHLGAFMALFLAAAAFTFACAVGLLKRRNWARIGFIAVMIVGIVWEVVGVALQFKIVTAMKQQLAAQLPANAPIDVQGMMTGTLVFGAVFALAFAVLFGWIVKRLMAPEVAAEFQR